MKRYKIDMEIGYTNGKTVRDMVYTFEKASKEDAIQWAKGQLALANHMPKIDWFYIYSVEAI